MGHLHDRCTLITVISFLPNNLVEMLLKPIDIAISDLFVKYQIHHGKTTKLQGEAPLIYTSGEVIA